MVREPSRLAATKPIFDGDGLGVELLGGDGAAEGFVPEIAGSDGRVEEPVPDGIRRLPVKQSKLEDRVRAWRGAEGDQSKGGEPGVQQMLQVVESLAGRGFEEAASETRERSSRSREDDQGR